MSAAPVVVHLLFTGIMAFSNQDGPPTTVIIPNFTSAQHHATIVVDAAAVETTLQPAWGSPIDHPDDPNVKLNVYKLEGYQIEIGFDASSAKFSSQRKDQVRMFDACPTEKCRVMKSEYAKAEPDAGHVSARMALTGGTLRDAWTDPFAQWKFVPPGNAGRVDPMRAAQMTCLEFKIASDKLVLKLRKFGSREVIQFAIKPTGGVIEARFGNTLSTEIVPKEARPYEATDKHFHLYYEMSEEPPPAQANRPTPTFVFKSNAGLPQSTHGHRLAFPFAALGPAYTSGAGLVSAEGPRTLGGGNCIPTLWP